MDKFTHCLLVKCSVEMLDTLLVTMIRQLQTTQDGSKQTEAKMFIRRFVRSVARIFVALSVESSPGHNKKKSPASARQPLQACKRVFQSLINISIEELCETGNALLGNFLCRGKKEMRNAAQYLQKLVDSLATTKTYSSLPVLSCA